jgi:hypothetical protein
VLATVATFAEAWEAHLFRLRLEAEGIPASVAHEHHIWVNWPYSLALGGVKVQVPRSEWENAVAVERRCRAGEYRAELAAEFGETDGAHCSNCGLIDVSSRCSLPRLALLIALYFLAGAIFPLRSSVHQRRSCGTSWQDRNAGSSAQA